MAIHRAMEPKDDPQPSQGHRQQASMALNDNYLELFLGYNVIDSPPGYCSAGAGFFLDVGIKTHGEIKLKQKDRFSLKKPLKNTAMALIDLPNIVTFTFSNFKQNFQPKSEKESKLH